MNLFQKFFWNQLTKRDAFSLIKKVYPAVKFVNDPNWSFKLGQRRFIVNYFLEVREKCFDTECYFETKLAKEIENTLLKTLNKYRKDEKASL